MGDRLSWKKYTLEEENYLYVDKEFTIKSHVLDSRITFWRQLTRCQISGACAQNPIVRTAQGEIRGQQKEAVTGSTYLSWNGVPYAKPPVGELRFKDSLSPEPWEGVRDALEDGSMCIQPRLGDGVWPDGSTIGDEDCLFLNIYSPQLPTWLEDSLPVLVYVHGGGFVIGSSSFLYLNESAPGNAGMKDQVMALRWVQKNIAGFLGRPSEVTLAGESAGGASVHLNVLSPLTKGLIRRAISQSGNALDRWAIQTAPEETSLRLADAVNCSREDYNQTVVCLRGVATQDLIVAAFSSALTDVDRNRLGPFTFVPTNDFPVEGVETFLPAPAIEMVKKNLYHPVPFLTGFTSRESFLNLPVAFFLNETVARILDASWDTKILPELSLPDDGDNNEEALSALRQFYMDGQPLTNDTLLGFMDMLTDIQFGKAVYYCLRMMAESYKTVLHQYIFDVSDELNTLKIALNVTDIPGAGHGEDNNYLFRIEGLPEVSENSSSARIRREMVRLWTNYIKFGDPTPIDDPLLQGVDWKPFTKHEHNYLYIGEELHSGKDLYKNRSLFWEGFYRKFGHD
ncbi:Esterase FE4 [Gryllus bimaculatus]|nr:Esterase FE4 [Gryllus bimaculatus]